jgi:PAS domain S-box-containing protein
MQINARSRQNVQIALQQVLTAITTCSDTGQSTTRILETFQNLTEAKGINFWLFDEPQTTITVGDSTNFRDPSALEQIARGLPIGIHLVPDEQSADTLHCWVVPVTRPDAVAIGALQIISEHRPDQFTEEEQITLQNLVHVLTLIAQMTLKDLEKQRDEQLMRSILSSITDPLFITDENKLILLLNPAAETLFQVTYQQCRGVPLAQVVQSDELMNLWENRNSNQAEWTTSDDRTYVPRSEPVYDPSVQVTGWVVILRDVTHFKKLNRNQSEFTRIVSHDLRSPLTSMQGFASMLELQMVGELNEKQAHFVEKILSGIAQMTTLVDNIQDAGRYDPETGFYEMSRSQCDLKEIVQRIIDNHLMPAEKGELKLSWFVADDIPIINADIHMLERAITNLIDNAIKYTPNGGKIDVRVERQDDHIILSVSDTGLGISPENQRHLFERHVRIARKEHKKIKGSGLGLFIVRSVAQRHGGTAWVRSVENEGSTFYMSIPLTDANLVGAKPAE